MIPPNIPDNESERLSALAKYNVLDTLSEHAFDDITLLASQICQVPIALISLIDENRQWFKSKIGLEATETPREISFCGHAIHQQTLFEVSNTLEDARFSDNPLVTGAPNIRFYAGMPLITHEGYAIGSLCVIDQKTRVLTSAQQASLAALARQVMQLLESRITVKKIALLAAQVEKKSAFNEALLTGAEACIISFSLNGIVQTFNRAAENLLGFHAHEVMHIASIDHFIDSNEIKARAQAMRLIEEAPKALDVLLAHTQSGLNARQEWSYSHKNGSKIPVRLSVSTIHHDDAIIGYVAIAYDVSMQKHYENSLFIANDQLSASLEAISGMVWVKSLNGEYMQCNHSFERYLGVNKSEIIGKRNVDFMDQESASVYSQKDQEAIQSGLPIIHEEWITFADGYHGLFEVTKTVTKDVNGDSIGVMSMARDITQLKKTELKMRAHRKAMHALNEIAAQTISQDYKQQIRDALLVACQYLGMAIGFVSKIEGDDCITEVQHSPDDTLYDGMVYPLAETYCALLLASEDVVYVKNIAVSPYANEKCYELMGYESFIGLQLDLDGKCYGGLMFCDEQPRYMAIESVEIEFIKLLSRWIMNTIKRNQLVEQVRIGNERITLALSGGNLGLWDLDIQTKQAVFNERWAEMLGYKLSEIEQSLATWQRLLHPDDVTYALEMVKAHLSGEIPELIMEFRMQHKDGHWVWIHDRGRVMERDIYGAPTRMVGTHMDITERKKAEEEIKLLAFYDVLTSLPNRRLLIDRLEHALVNSARSKCNGALIFIDLDNFKTLNDTLGHDKGDALLKRVATRLLSCLRDGDTVARFGGDEFVVMLDNLDEAIDLAVIQVEKVGEKIIQSLNQPYDLGGQQYLSSPTLGATLFNGQTDKVDDSLKRADIAMYQAKNAGKNCLRFFDQHIQANLLHKTKLEEDLRYGIDNKQFVLYYQPQVDSHGQITGAEALVRWSHPERGLVSPLEFISLAEETGLIIQLGSWVLETGCKQLVAWSRDPHSSDFNLSINVSARQFHQPDFVAQVLNTLKVTGANPHKLKLELTESMLVDDVDDVITKMSQLQLKGVSFSLDDFGTGFSSLSFLKLLPLNQLKIDKSFVRDILTDPNDAVIARTIVALANSLGLTVIAEGVEMEGQRDFLAENGCYDYQGYFFSRPLTIEDFDVYTHSFTNSTQQMQDLWESAFSSSSLKQASLFY